MSSNQILVDRLANELLSINAFITTAESCTGGWIAKTLTDKPGSSAWFEYGFVSYGNHAKTDMLQVPPELITQYSAVSHEVAQAMVAGALSVSGAYLGLATTGLAGPDGGGPDNPVGTVCFAYGARGKEIISHCQHFDGDRDTVRRQTVRTALAGVLEYLENNSD